MTQTVKAGFIYFVLVFAAGFMLGTIRVTFLIPRFGPTTAVLVELPIILAVAWNVCGIVLRHVEVAAEFGPRLVMGTVAFVVLMLAETALATLAFSQTIPEIAAQYSTAHGAIGLAGQAIFASIPLLRLAAERHARP